MRIVFSGDGTAGDASPRGTWRPEKDQILQKRRIYDYEKLIISAFSFLGMSEKMIVYLVVKLLLISAFHSPLAE